MKILILCDYFPPQRFASVDMIAFRLAKGFQKLGHDVSVITTAKKSVEEGRDNYEGIEIFKIYSNYHERWRAYLSLYNPQTVNKIKKIVNEIKPDIVHVHNIHFHLSYYCLKIAKQSGAKVFLSVYDVILFHYGKLMEFINPKDFSCPGKFNYKIRAWQQIKRFKKRYNPLRNIIIRHYLKYVDKIFAESHALKKALNINGIENVEVIHAGIEADDWSVKDSSVSEFKNKLNLQNKRIIFYGGRLSWSKGGGQIIKAMKKIIEKIPGAILLIVGKIDDQTIGLMELTKKMGLEEKIVFTGWISREELRAAFWASEMVVVPSICFDTFPTINLEAMACQRPVIATCFGGSPEIVQDGVTGYIINPFNTEVLAGKIVDLLNFPQKAKEFGEAGYELVKNKFSLNIQINQTLLWYKRFLSIS